MSCRRDATGSVSHISSANYRAACRARSEREFHAKLHIALEEADESVRWLELLNEGGRLPEGKLDDLLLEARAIMFVLGRSEKTARDKQKKANK